MKRLSKQCPGQEYLHAFYQGNHLNFGIALALQLVIALFNPFISWILGAVTDCMTTGNIKELMNILWIVLAMLPLFAAVAYLTGRVKAKFIRKASVQYKELAFDRLSQKSISAFSRENTSRYLSALTNDVNAVEQEYLDNRIQLVQQCATFVLALAMMLYYHVGMTLVVIVVALIPILISVVMGKRYAVLEKSVSDENEKFTAQVRDLLSGFGVIKSFKAERQSAALFQSANNGVESRKLEKRLYGALLNTASLCAGLVLQLGIFIFGAFLAVRGEITVGTVMVFVNLSGIAMYPIQVVPTYWAGQKAARALIHKLAELNAENAGHNGDQIAPVLKESIDMEHVSFGYEEGKPVLKDVNLRMEAGKKYALVGASGSGKSTLLNLLMGAYDGYQGSITIDGKQLRTVDSDSLYDLISLIGQNVFLFDNTIRENITMFRHFPDEAVNSAVNRSGLAAVIAAKGENYRCGENGNGLSGGERQRVSIARSLLRNTPVLMLDEATAALDNQTAFEVTDAILKLDGLTRIVVTHRLEEALLRQYDEIIVLRDGRIIEQGTFENLMEETGYFHSLFTVSNP